VTQNVQEILQLAARIAQVAAGESSMQKRSNAELVNGILGMPFEGTIDLFFSFWFN
jgi:hypothetical protein